MYQGNFFPNNKKPLLNKTCIALTIKNPYFISLVNYQWRKSLMEYRYFIIKLIKSGVIYNGGVGLYDTFVHYDIGAQGRRWDYRKKK